MSDDPAAPKVAQVFEFPDHVIQIPITDDPSAGISEYELALLRQKALAAGVTLSTYMQNLARKDVMGGNAS